VISVTVAIRSTLQSFALKLHQHLLVQDETPGPVERSLMRELTAELAGFGRRWAGRRCRYPVELQETSNKTIH
jgi:hypothetical protein